MKILHNDYSGLNTAAKFKLIYQTRKTPCMIYAGEGSLKS